MKKYTILGLVILNNMFNQAMPAMALSVLLKDISADLDMNLVQAGYLWASPQILAILSSFFGGAITEWFGERKILIFSSYGLSILGITRALGWNFSSELVFTMLFGFFTPLTMLANFKLLQNNFSENDLSLANGLMSAGMALGFLFGSWISATFVAPLVGGWRGVFVIYALISFLFPTILAFYIKPEPRKISRKLDLSAIFSPLKQAVKNLNIWLLGFGLFGLNSAIQSYLGYLPTYLQNIGWSVAEASGAMTTFHLASLSIAVIVAIYSKRLRESRSLTIFTASIILVGLIATSFAKGSWVLVSVVTAGVFRDAFMAMFFTYVAEVSREVRIAAGAALGFTMMMNGIGNVIAPPFGNSFHTLSPTAPFWIWTAIGIFGLVSLLLIRKQTPPKII
ncbi:MAG TPA: MFS transporter [Anaerolineales bacterium]|nr:MFS transporter [Anaerolineales bacterium]